MRHNAYTNRYDDDILIVVLVSLVYYIMIASQIPVVVNTPDELAKSKGSVHFLKKSELEVSFLVFGKLLRRVYCINGRSNVLQLHRFLSVVIHTQHVLGIACQSHGT